ncbi:hypothetical protein VTO42DRAFT_79 [Malbranchea cinnamomea]
MATAPSLPPASALTTLISQSQDPENPITALTLQVFHNLQHQHLWTSLRIHEPRTLSPSQSIPLISGIPPQSIYIHPDEQAYMLELGIRLEETAVDREWVIPTAQGQTWSLRRLAEVFDALPDRKEDIQAPDSKRGLVSNKVLEYERKKREEPWGGKRALLSMVNRNKGGDGTVVYYIILEGTVKPRQN